MATGRLELPDGHYLDCVRCDACGLVISMYSDEAAEWTWDDEGCHCMCLLCVEDIERENIVGVVGIAGLEQARGRMDGMWAELEDPGLDLS